MKFFTRTHILSIVITVLCLPLGASFIINLIKQDCDFLQLLSNYDILWVLILCRIMLTCIIKDAKEDLDALKKSLE